MSKVLKCEQRILICDHKLIFMLSFKLCSEITDLHHTNKFLTVDIAVLLANIMVSSQLDYYNSLLYGVRKGSVVKVQNVLYHFVFQIRQNQSCQTLP